MPNHDEPDPAEPAHGKTETDLTAFGGGVSIDPPRIQKAGRVHTATPDETRVAGHVARAANRTGRVFITTRDSHDHRIRHLHDDEGGSYAISADVIDRLDRQDVSRVLIHEPDRDTVLEWPLTAFIEGDPVPETFLQTTGDPQEYATRDSAEHVWEDQTPEDLYIPRGTALDDPGVPATDGGDGDGE